MQLSISALWLSACGFFFLLYGIRGLKTGQIWARKPKSSEPERLLTKRDAYLYSVGCIFFGVAFIFGGFLSCLEDSR